MAARKYSVGIGPVPVPPTLSGSSTTSSNPAAPSRNTATRHRQPPSQRAVTEFVCGSSAVMRVVVAMSGRPVVRRPGREQRLAGPQVIAAHHPALAQRPFQGPEPAAVVAPVAAVAGPGLPAADLGDQVLPEVLPVDPPGLLQ